jgi:hypothetical protein
VVTLDVEPAAKELTEFEVRYILGRELGECEGCGATEGVELEGSRTCYTHGPSDDGPEDPNRQVALCRSCAKEHHEHWDSMWADYYGSRL